MNYLFEIQIAIKFESEIKESFSFSIILDITSSLLKPFSVKGGKLSQLHLLTFPFSVRIAIFSVV